MDWVAVTHQQVENDELPNVCMVCGQPATDRINRTFRHTPKWIEPLYFAGILPGLIAESMYRRDVRVSCPVCPTHRNHWSTPLWVVGLGWLVPLLSGIPTLLLGFFVLELEPGLIAGITLTPVVIGLVLWITLLVRLFGTQVHVTEITATEIKFERVADEFAKAVKAMRSDAKEQEPASIYAALFKLGSSRTGNQP